MIYYADRFIKNKFLRFSIVGFSGTLTNLLIFWFVVDYLKNSANAGSTIAFIFAVTQNYFLNHFWSFQEYSKRISPSFAGYFKFVCVSLIGFGVNILILNLILHFLVLPLKVIAQAIGILAGLIVNYLGSSKFVFKD
ncbi:MAG: GtrA family protein [Exilispira sp.]